MELCYGERLIEQMVKDMPYLNQRPANIVKEVMLVIMYCHDMGFVHNGFNILRGSPLVMF